MISSPTQNAGVPTRRRHNNPIPRREHPLILDSSEYDELEDRLMTELRPPNAAAEYIVRQLAQELLNLQFAQSVQFALIDQAQAISDGGLRRRREMNFMWTKGRTADEFRHEMAILTPFCNAIQAGTSPDVANEDVEWLADMMWQQINRYETDGQEIRERIADIDDYLRLAETESDQQCLLRNRAQELTYLKESEDDDKKAGRRAHGVETRQDVFNIVLGEATVTDATRAVWVATIGDRVSIANTRRIMAEEDEQQMASLRAVALNNAASSIDRLEPIHRHITTVWKNVERCVKQLALMGVDMKRAPCITIAAGGEDTNHVDL